MSCSFEELQSPHERAGSLISWESIRLVEGGSGWLEGSEEEQGREVGAGAGRMVSKALLLEQGP